MRFDGAAGIALAASAALVHIVAGNVTILNVNAKVFANNAIASPLQVTQHSSPNDAVALFGRSLPNAPNGYTPEPATCPSNRPTIREATGLSANETEWLKSRRPQALQSMRTLFQQLNITGLDTNSYFDNHAGNESMLPNVAIAVSGGGYRAMLNGAGALAAFDNRTRRNSTAGAALSGLLQSATYLAGLSGGSWLVGSLYTNNFTSVQAILDDDLATNGSGSLWQLGNSILEGPSTGSIQLLDTAGYYITIQDQVHGKSEAGYNITITDYWGRMLSFQLINADAGGPSYTFSSIALQDWFTNGSTPLPLIVSDQRSPGQIIVSANSTIQEFSPWELGTWDPTIYGFAPLEYLGTNFSQGIVPSGDECVRGLDNSGYVMGTSSTLFNAILTSVNSSLITSNVLFEAVAAVLKELGENDEDIADYPNPFFGFNNATNQIYNDPRLTLTDGGEDGQNIPLHPLIQPVRNVDVIFAIDSSADTDYNWPNGSALVATYERQFDPISNGTVFPSVPGQNTFVNLGLNNRPTFFGCDASNSSGPTPLIVYIPNAPYVSSLADHVD